MADEEKKQSSDDGGVSLPAPPPEEEEGGGGAPEWMATFADLVTLLMCFFVLMFAMSSTQQDSFKQLVQSLKSALGVQSVPEAGTREGLTMMDVIVDEKKAEAVDEAGGMVQQEVDQIVSDVQELVMFNKLGGLVNVQESEVGATVTISDMALFPAGAAKMSSNGLTIMAKVSKVLSQFPYHTKISGHTDNRPIHTAMHPSNWELAGDRACEVVRFLISQGLDPTKLSAESYADFRPIASNDTPEGRAKNRRVEIIYERQSISNTLTRAPAGSASAEQAQNATDKIIDTGIETKMNEMN